MADTLQGLPGGFDFSDIDGGGWDSFGRNKKHGGKNGKGGKNGGGKGGGDDSPDPMDDPQNQAIYTILKQQFADLGLDTLAPLIMQYVVEGYSPDVIGILLSETPEYKQRFSGNEEIKKRIASGETGLHVLSPAEYIQQEKQYKDALSFYGLPQGFYDSPDDFAGWIGQGVSVLEVQERARLAKETVNGSPEISDALRRYYPELGDGDIAAYILDQKRAMPLIEQKVAAANIGAGADFQGLSVDRMRAEDLAKYGVTADQARQGYSAIAEALPTAEKLADLEGGQFSQSDLEDEVFKQSATAAKKRKDLASHERARFSASGGANQYSFVKDKGDF
jgi:hypothetical protein